MVAPQFRIPVTPAPVQLGATEAVICRTLKFSVLTVK